MSIFSFYQTTPTAQKETGPDPTSNEKLAN